VAADSQEWRELRQLIDRSKIHAVLVRYARGIDRRDALLVRSCFHHDAIEEHGTFSGPAAEFVDFVMPRLSRFQMTTHNLCNMWIETKGPQAVAETYFFALHVFAEDLEDRKPDLLLTGRYIDRFEKRAGEWKISHRQLVCDYVRQLETAETAESALGIARMMQQRAGTDDFVYTRWAEIAEYPTNSNE
jgi:hypothetical protein